MSLAAICTLGLTLPIAPKAVLFLWATAPKLLEALQVMSAWGFTYCTHAVWDKKRVGMGYWFRGRHELLLVGKRGAYKPPIPKVRVASIIEESRTEHSKKPEIVRAWLDRAFPQAQKLELFARTYAPNWTSWGNELPQPTKEKAHVS